jgi:hypothetical protein
MKEMKDMYKGDAKDALPDDERKAALADLTNTLAPEKQKELLPTKTLVQQRRKSTRQGHRRSEGDRCSLRTRRTKLLLIC